MLYIVSIFHSSVMNLLPLRIILDTKLTQDKLIQETADSTSWNWESLNVEIRLYLPLFTRVLCKCGSKIIPSVLVELSVNMPFSIQD